MTRTPLSTSLDGYEIWFVTGSQNLYGEETLRQVAEQSQEIARTLGAASDVPVKVVWKPVLKDSESIRRAALDANADDAVIGLIAWMHTFSPAKMWIAGLDALSKPLLHLPPQANVGLPWGEIDFDFMNLNQAAHGDREFGYIETRLGIPRTTVVRGVRSRVRMNPYSRSPWAAWLRFMKSMSMLCQGNSTPNWVCRCRSGLCSVLSPRIHILAGEKVCIQAMTPMHSSELLASLRIRAIESESVTTGTQRTSTGISVLRSSRSAI